ncbi:MAG: type II toxin-antitoxin system HicB family antitoxin [Ktedonobacterales bacterium]
MMTNGSHYSMVIEWSNEDHTYIVSFPEWGDITHTHGDSYEEAVRHGCEVLDDLIAIWQQQGRSLPEPRVFAASA